MLKKLELLRSEKDDLHKQVGENVRLVDRKCANQVWNTDITYICLKSGFVYLTNILESRGIAINMAGKIGL